MPTIPIEEPIVPDIYSYGFDRNLNRAAPGLSTNVVYDYFENKVQGQTIEFGSLVVGGTQLALTSSSGIGTTIAIRGAPVTTQGSFGGDGSDGELRIDSGTTTLNIANTQIYVRNYTKISITGTGTLAFSNPNGSGTIIILKSQGDVNLTSTASPLIDASGMGAAAGTGATTINAPGTEGEYFRDVLDSTIHGGNNGKISGNGGIASTAVTETGAGSFYSRSSAKLLRHTRIVIPGSGGGGGGTDNNANFGNGGNGGRGGGALIIECGGSWNFITTNGISVAGLAGSNGTNGGADSGGGGGGGGGSGGQCLVLYRTLASNLGTINVSGGAGGSGGTGQGTGAGGGGAAGGALFANSTAGSNNSGSTGGAGGAGSVGLSFVTQNIYF